MKMNDEQPQGPLRSGTLARLASLSADTLRFYERRGLLPRPPRDANGYRRYPPGALKRVLVIQQALAAGFTVDELSRILRRRDSGGAPCREVYRIARERIDQLEERILSLTELRDQLRVVIAGWEQRLAETAPGERAGLLDRLARESLPPAHGREPSASTRGTIGRPPWLCGDLLRGQPDDPFTLTL